MHKLTTMYTSPFHYILYTDTNVIIYIINQEKKKNAQIIIIHVNTSISRRLLSSKSLIHLKNNTERETEQSLF